MKHFTLFLFTLCCLAATCREGRNAASADCIDKSKIGLEMACIEVYEPVCGCDGKTYPNDCYAQRAGIKHWEEGPCENY